MVKTPHRSTSNVRSSNANVIVRMRLARAPDYNYQPVPPPVPRRYAARYGIDIAIGTCTYIYMY